MPEVVSAECGFGSRLMRQWLLHKSRVENQEEPATNSRDLTTLGRGYKSFSVTLLRCL